MQISELSGVGAKRAHALFEAGIYTVADLLNHFPRDYDDRSRVKTVAELTPGAVNTLRGVVAFEPQSAVLARKGQKGTLNITKVIVKDRTGTLELVWFNQPYLKKTFRKGSEYIFTGKVRLLSFGAETRVQMQSPDYEQAGALELSGGRIVPLYTTPKGYSQKTFRALIYQALNMPRNSLASLPKAAAGREAFTDCLPNKIRVEYALCDRETAVKNIHFPESDALFLEARRRLVFEELFFMQLALHNIKNAVSAQPGVILADTDYAPFLAELNFALTAAQARVLDDIAKEMRGGRRMNRLVQGDVGSGKTAVAMAAAYLAMKNGFQAALMAPTEVLASQHFEQCKRLFGPLGFETVLLTGSAGAKARREALEKISEGRAAMVVGTHALIQKGVAFFRLGLCVTDEQHRFGVNQRLNLLEKARAMPHTLVMTATPIPRTLGLILYGDLDISVIDELPPGRRAIKTYCVGSGYRERINGFIRKEAEQGNQVYIICPAIEESENPDFSAKTELQNVLNYTRELSAALPGINIANLHGRMKPAEKQSVMDAFKAGEIQAIVSTTVIEVGVHVEKATLIIIENAERFGLSQLHQLRGRVGRGAAQSYCVLLTDTKNEQTNARMKAMTQTTDGFKLAELDLEQRGAGDFFGTRQHGLPSFTIANLYRDIEILSEAQSAAEMLDKPKLSNKETAVLRQKAATILSEKNVVM